MLGAPRTLGAPGLCPAQLIGCDATGVYPQVGSGRNFRRGSGTGLRVRVSKSATGTGRVAEMVDPHTSNRDTAFHSVSQTDNV